MIFFQISLRHYIKFETINIYLICGAQALMEKKKYNVIGMMSGTSTDGIDLSLASYSLNQEAFWNFQIIKVQTYPYEENILKVLKKIKQSTLRNFLKLNIQYSQYVVKCINDFKSGIQIKIDLIALHGHTIFHVPQEQITFQCGDPTYIAAKTKINTIGNFRQLDVYRGGQGAPLVPFGNELFNNFDGFLNLGGICNIDFHGDIGWDIGFCNLFFNYFSNKLGKQYDDKGLMGRTGKFSEQINKLLRQQVKLNELSKVKSFGFQQFTVLIQKIQRCQQKNPVDIMHTYYIFLAELILKNCQYLRKNFLKKLIQIRIMITGKGVYNEYLVELMNKNEINIRFILPDQKIIEFKEAIVFGLLGVKFIEGTKNCERGIGGMLVKGLWQIPQDPSKK